MKLSLKKKSLLGLITFGAIQLVGTAVHAWTARCGNQPTPRYNLWYHVTWYCTNGDGGSFNEHNVYPAPVAGDFSSGGYPCYRSYTIETDYATACAP